MNLRRLTHRIRLFAHHRLMDHHPPPSRNIRVRGHVVEAAELMEFRRITSVLVLDVSGRLCGALNSNDLMRAKVI